MTHPAYHLLESPCLATLVGCLSQFPQVAKIYLVGGAVRDVMLGRPPVDFDFTSEHDPTALARAFATQCEGHWFWLDEQRRQSRVVIAEGTFDFAPWRAPTLAADLAARDFTINAMAIDLTVFPNAKELIDPLNGRNDLSGKILRCVGPNVLQDDPLRVLKGIRHAAELELEIEPVTLWAMQSAAAKLTASAPERVRVEIWRILAAAAVCRGLDWLAECGAAEILFGRDFCDGTAIVQRSVLRANALFAALADDNPTIAEWLSEPVEQGMDRRMLLHWSHALGVINAELPLMMAHRWRFSRNALSRIAALRSLTPQLWQELLNLPRRPRPIALWALNHGPDPVDLLLALGALQDDEADAVRNQLAPIMALLAELPEVKRLPPLVNGSWLKSELGAEGMELGAILAQLRLAEIDGVVNDAVDARRYLVRHYLEKC